MAATDPVADAGGVDGPVPSTPPGGAVLVPTDEGGAAVMPTHPGPAAVGPVGGEAHRSSADAGRVADGGGAASAAGAHAPESDTLWERVRASLSTARSLWRDFTGESGYDRYVERHRREHPDHEPMTEREFWRDRARFDEDNVSTGCC